MAILYLLCTLLLTGARPLTAFNDTDIHVHLNGSFDEQVAQIMRHRQQHKNDYKNMYKALADVRKALRTLWPDAIITPFGSRFSGVGTAGSDIDCFIRLPSSSQTNSSLLVVKAAKALEHYPQLFAQIVTESTGRVPILRTIHVPSKIDFDLSFSGASSIANTKLLKYIFHLDERILKLAVILKYWEEKQITEKIKNPSSYTVVLMLIFFLQQKQMLPAVADLQKNVAPHMEDNWNVAFERIPFKPRSDLELFDLLVGFFEFYAYFPYEEFVIAPFIGYPVQRERFINYQSLPDEYKMYKFNMRRNLTVPLFLNGDIVVQEPFDHNRNMATTLLHRYAQHAIETFKKANAIYHTNSNPDEYLTSIMKQL